MCQRPAMLTQLSQSCRKQRPSTTREWYGSVGERRLMRWWFGVVAALLCVGLAAAQLHRVEVTLARSASAALARSFGTAATAAATVNVHLLPRPGVVIRDVSLDGPAGMRINAPVLEATQSIASLLSGRLAFSRIRLVGPAIALDADALPAAGARSAMALLGRTLPQRVFIEDGTLTLASRHAALRGTVTAVSAVLDGLDHNGTLALTGSGTWRGTRLAIAAEVDPAFDFALGRPATSRVTLRSQLLDATLEGQLRAGIHGGFEGRVAVSTLALPDLLQASGSPPGLGRLVERLSFSGSGVANRDTITFSDAHLGLDDTAFEGSLAWQPNGGHWAWTGTFATDALDLTGAVAAVSHLRDRGGRWSDAPWTIDPALLGDVDLRISASRALIGPLVMEDAAFSALCRDGRIEAGFSEARSLDGLIRGRAVASVTGRSVALRVDLSASQMDLDPLAQALGATGISGSVSGRLVAEATGTSPRALAASLAGHGQLSVRNGALPALPSIADVSALGPSLPIWLRTHATTPFDLATADLRLTDERLSVVDGRLVAADRQPRSFTAEASLSDRSFSLMAQPSVGGGTTAATTVAGILGTPPRILRAEADGTTTAASTQGLP
ncbi:AsmA-like C-terminal region-containing protein [Lichenihabitans sp. Uapishka_5]|uniref:AsmA family protein n=1 Tax=Lichenihabitans sp. Uapishka_5 TaxID=3037302 RepID=UPI0029E8015C|nr:AsmA-like C-terminal region-containing protein [Lichenihabitans sp. Uapishka_5]MDX7950913.1 AsmA-like C-terminal region-containing protein [Lichenihabitans sp. Uapishka_5]